MNWKITRRDADGNRYEEMIEADSREELFKTLSARGITAVQIEEAGNKNPSACRARRIRQSHNAWAGAVLLVAAIACIFVFHRENATVPVATSKPVRQIKELKPAIPKPAKPVVEEAMPKVDPNARPAKVGEIVNNYIMLPSGKIHHIRGEVTNNVAETSRDWFAVFDHRCENELACLLTLEPGETLVGTPVYRGRFVKEFLKSLETPIVASPDDPQEIRDLKKMVTEAKIELKAAYDRGEDIEQIMLDTRNQMQDLAAYRQTLESEMWSTIKENAASDDVEDFITAANEMLARKGIAPMELNPLMRKRLQRMIEKKKGQIE